MPKGVYIRTPGLKRKSPAPGLKRKSPSRESVLARVARDRAKFLAQPIDLLKKQKGAYRGHKNTCRNKLDAAGQKVELKLTFEQWWDIWETSGYWEQRGKRSDQYVMSRYNDLGHYELGNVFIQLGSDNKREAMVGKPGRTKGMKFPNRKRPKQTVMDNNLQGPEFG